MGRQQWPNQRINSRCNAMSRCFIKKNNQRALALSQRIINNKMWNDFSRFWHPNKQHEQSSIINGNPNPVLKRNEVTT